MRPGPEVKTFLENLPPWLVLTLKRHDYEGEARKKGQAVTLDLELTIQPGWQSFDKADDGKAAQKQRSEVRRPRLACSDSDAGLPLLHASPSCLLLLNILCK